MYLLSGYLFKLNNFSKFLIKIFTDLRSKIFYNLLFILCLGPVVGGLLNNFETRRIVVIGALIASTSFVLSTFSPNIFVYYFVYGILGGMFLMIFFYF